MNQSSITDPVGEQLSALMDGELPPEQVRFLLRRLDADASLPTRWSRYHAARAALRRQGGAQLRADFADVVMQRLANETVVAVPRGGRVLRWLGGGAIAASVAVVALVMTARPGSHEPTGGILVASVPATPAAAPADVRGATPTRVPTLVSPPPSALFGAGAEVAPAAWEVPYGRQPYGAAMNPYFLSRGTPLLLPVQPAAERKAAEPAPQP